MTLVEVIGPDCLDCGHELASHTWSEPQGEFIGGCDDCECSGYRYEVRKQPVLGGGLTVTLHLSANFDESEDGWIVPTCTCGWTFGPVPDREIAVDVLMAHAGGAAGKDEGEDSP